MPAPTSDRGVIVASMSDIGSGVEPEDLQGGSWLRPATEDNDLRRYMTTLRERRWLILVCVLITTLVALAYVEIKAPVYKAQANLLIVPANVSGNVTLTGLPLIQSSSDPTRDVETASQLVTTVNVAAGVKATLGLSGTPRQILSKVTATPVAQSNVVAVTAQGSSPAAAARLANGFVNEVIAERTANFQSRIDRQIALLKQQIATAPQDIATRLANGVSQLQSLRSGPLPDMRVATTAQPPSGPSSPRKALSIAVGIVSGLLIGLVSAFALEGLDPRLHREEQLRRLFTLPVLARIPREGPALGGGVTRTLARVPLIGELGQRWRNRRSLPRSPMSLSPVALEGYRTLRATLLASRPIPCRARRASARIHPRSILVTGAGPWEGKTTTAINLAVSLAWSGASVILIEADLRRPSMGTALSVDSRLDVSHVLRGQVRLEQALVQPKDYGANLRVLLAGGHGASSAFVGDELLLPAASGLLSSAQELADYVVIDSPPLAEVVDALEIARQADEVLLVVRLGYTQTARLRRLGSLLARTRVQPVGITVIGTEPPRPSERYPYVGSNSPRQSTPEKLRLTAP
jgi:Mrp family chromosome partitioning ATPase/capsular polysaccharide biosynthesis protein